MTYVEKTTSFGHQAQEFFTHGFSEARGELWEQGTGKTKPIIDSAAALYERRDLNGMMILAPNGVHRNWIANEYPAHLPDRIAEKARYHVWTSNDTKKHKAHFDWMMAGQGFTALAMSYDALMTNRGRDAWKKYLKTKETMYALDESMYIKTPNTKRVKRIATSNVASNFRRIMTGTPITNTPFDIYSQIKFLDPNVWHPYGIREFSAFKTYFGIWIESNFRDSRGNAVSQCVEYKNLDLLKSIVAKYCTRYLKEDVLDLPPKLYTKHYFELTNQQKKIYRALRDEYRAELDSGAEISAPLAIVRLLRLQQIVCGYLPEDDSSKVLRPIPGANPRMDALIEDLNLLGHQALVWARFHEDIDQIYGRLGQQKADWVDGRKVDKPRDAVIDGFCVGDFQFLVATPSSIGEGYTLNGAKSSHYYSNSFNLKDRLQSEDRNHRIGQDDKVFYTDYIGLIDGKAAIDDRLLDNLRNKVDVASQVTGDELREWI